MCYHYLYETKFKGLLFVKEKVFSFMNRPITIDFFCKPFVQSCPLTIAYVEGVVVQLVCVDNCPNCVSNFPKESDSIPNIIRDLIVVNDVIISSKSGKTTIIVFDPIEHNLIVVQLNTILHSVVFDINSFSHE